MLRYHMSLIPKNLNLKYAVWFLYGDSIQGELRNKREGISGGVDPLHMFDEKAGADDDVSRNAVRVEMTGEEHKNTALDVWPNYSMDAPTVTEEDRKVRTLYFKFFCMLCLGGIVHKIFCMPFFR